MYYGIRSRREASNSEELIRLTEKDDWSDRNWSYFGFYLKIYPNGEHRINELPTRKENDNYSVKRWCEKKWESGTVDELVKYWCYMRNTWLEEATKDNPGLSLKTAVTANNKGKYVEYEGIKKGLGGESPDKRLFEALEKESTGNGEMNQALTAVNWCNTESGLFYEKETDVYKLFKDNCLTNTPN